MPVSSRSASLRLVGYARVSTEDRASIRSSMSYGRQAALPSARLRRGPQPAGDGTAAPLLWVRLDRLARSVADLLSVIEQPEASGAHFRSLHDPVDMTTPQGMFSLQVVGAGPSSSEPSSPNGPSRPAHGSQGRIGGNPGLRARDPEVIRKLGLAATPRI